MLYIYCSLLTSTELKNIFLHPYLQQKCYRNWLLKPYVLAASAPILLQSHFICYIQITKSYEASVQLFPVETSNTFKDDGYAHDHHWSIPSHS